ncbi:MAG: ferrochelatase [Rhodothermales bacterium]
MTTGILLLNFGEPERPELDEVVPFLEAIFLANMRLEHAADAEAGRRRARMLAERRAPALVADYRRMGASPLAEQTRAQARALDVALRRRGFEARVAVGMQFTGPSIVDAVRTLCRAGVDRLVGLPLYPLCGASTTIMALERLQDALAALDWHPDVTEITGWHRHPDYSILRTRAVRMYCEEAEIDLGGVDTRLVFSAHGTPLKYLEEGNRYDLYVRDHCRELARRLGVEHYELGYQNHDNRPDVEWTLPEIGEVVRHVEAERVVVVPVSFMQEQSETLVELDLDLREDADSVGVSFHRVPIPYDDPQFVMLLAQLVQNACAVERRACRCRPGAYCLNDRLEYEASVSSS